MYALKDLIYYRVDSKTITKASKKPTQKLPEAVVAPLKQEIAAPEPEDMSALDANQSGSTENESLYMDAEAFHQDELDPLDG